MGLRRGTLLLTALLALAYLGLAAAGPLAVGAWQDDAIYLATAKSLASGAGYRHAEIPGEPLQAKYPILYPAALALLWRVAPDYPRNVPLLLAPTAVAAAVFVVLAARYARRRLGLGRRETWVLGGLAALSPPILSMVRFTMSDLLYAALAVGAIGLLDGAAEGGRASGRRARLAGAALLLAACVLTRTIGLSLVAGALALLLWRRRAGDALRLGGGIALLLAPWLVRQVWAAGENAAAFSGTLLASELGYEVWRPRTLEEPLRVAFQNVVKLAFGLPYFQLGLPESLGVAALEGRSWATALVHPMGYACLALVALGFAASARRALRAVHPCAIAYAIVMLAYPGDPYRFLLPWTPFLLTFLFAGLEAALRRWPPLARGAAAALAALLAVLFVGEAWRIATSSAEDYHFRVAPRNWEELRALERWVRAFTDEDDVIASGDFAALYLATGRQGYYLWPILDPYAQFYGRDRPWRSFFIRAGPSASEALARETHELLVEAYRAAGVDWYVDNARPDLMTAAVRESAVRHPRLFEPRYTTPGGAYRVYRVRIP